MLSQALPNELVAPKSYMPPRVKSAYLKLVGNHNDQQDLNGSFNYASTNSFDYDNREERLNYKKSEDYPDEIVYRSNHFKQPPTHRGDENTRLLSAHEIVSARNANERIKELEQTNLNLKRMLDLVSSDPTNNLEKAKSAHSKLLVNRSNNTNPLGPPVLRQGRIGSSWRHIKQTNNYGNANLLFIDGTVRINDSARYPPRVYGYPPKTNDNQEIIGLNTQSLNDLNLPVSDRVRNRGSNLNSHSNQFHDRAKQGFEYWTKDKRIPENNKPKAKLYTTGAYKTFYGLSDSLLKL